MNILVINCSPVKNGATAEIVKSVSEYIKDGNEVRTICIDDYDVKLCRGCRKCHETAKYLPRGWMRSRHFAMKLQIRNSQVSENRDPNIKNRIRRRSGTALFEVLFCLGRL